MDKRYRYIYFYDISIKTESTSRGIVAVAQRSIKDILEKVTESSPKDRYYSYQKDTLHFYIADWEYKEELGQYHLLINKSDQNSADPTFSNISRSIERREISKRAGEGLDSSSHIILKLDEENPYKATLLLERGSIAGAHHIQTIFTRLVSDAKKTRPDFFEQNHPDGSLVKGLPKKVNVRYEVEVDGHISEDFKEDLKQGTFQELVLMTDSVVEGSTDSNFIQTQQTETIKLNPTKSFTFDSLKNLVTRKSDKFEKARVRFKLRDGTDRDIEVDTETFSENNYVKRSRIEAPVSFKSSYALIDSTIINLMKTLH